MKSVKIGRLLLKLSLIIILSLAEPIGAKIEKYITNKETGKIEKFNF